MHCVLFIFYTSMLTLQASKHTHVFKCWALIGQDRIICPQYPVFFMVSTFTYITCLSEIYYNLMPHLNFLTWFIKRDSWFENSRRRWARSCWALSCFSSYCLWIETINRHDLLLPSVTQTSIVVWSVMNTNSNH